MNFIKILLGAAVIAALSVGTAQAGQIENNGYTYGGNTDCSGGANTCAPLQLTGTASNGAISIWNFTCSGGLGAACADALPSNPDLSGHLLYSGLYTGPINFALNSGSDTVGAFLATAGGSFNSALSTTQKNAVLSTGFNSYGHGTVTIMELTFTLGSSATLSLQHDDGISIWGTGSHSGTDYLNSSNPTVEISSSILLAGGTYNLWYAEVNGLPADLITCLVPSTQNINVPEPLTLSLFGAGLAGAFVLRRRRKADQAS